jgi:DNA-binding response OmpR family regulator
LADENYRLLMTLEVGHPEREPRVRILVIEDDDDIRSICEHMFTWAGHQVSAAVDATRGLELVESFAPDVIALDLMMPGIDGLSVLAVLRGSASTCDVPVVIVSARTLTADQLRAFEAGADEYVSKPFDPDALLRILEGAWLTSPEERAAGRREKILALGRRESARS